MTAEFEADLPSLTRSARESQGEERQAAQRHLRERAQAALQDYRIKWLQHAAIPAQSAFMKWTLFLSDVYVVGAEKVRSPHLLWRHFDLLAANALGRATDLTKAISRSPAMVRYLDLDRSVREAPNENFARELFELFVLGEGNYSEQDIKEAARAFTGYRVNAATAEFRFIARQHDAGRKTIFGRTAAFTGDDVIDLAYEQPAAARFLPQEMVRFYLSDRPLPTETLTALGEIWRAARFDLHGLVRTFFGSRLFYAPEHRGGLIKSPVQFYLGALQDLGLDVPPTPRHVLNPLRQMGQQLFQPPNVRGWVGGRSWINSSTLAARRNLVQQLFTPLREETLNADEQQALARSRAAGIARFTVTDEWLKRLAELSAENAARWLRQSFLPSEDRTVQTVLADFLKRPVAEARKLARVRDAAITFFQTPQYQLC